MSERFRRRAGDRHWNRSHWYRDLWLLAISVVVVLALISAQDAIDQIQASRLAACQEQDQRHDRAVATLDRLRPVAHALDPARRAFTVALIDRLAPHQNCRAVVARTTARH